MVPQVATLEVVRTGQIEEFQFPSGVVRPKIAVISEASSSDGSTTWVLLGETVIDGEQIVFPALFKECADVQSPRDIKDCMVYIMRPIASGANDTRFIRVEEGGALRKEALEYWRRYCES